MKQKLTFIWKRNFFPVFYSAIFMFFAHSNLFISWVRSCFFRVFLAFLPAFNRRRRTVPELMWTPACIKSFCKSKLVFLAYLLQWLFKVQSQCSKSITMQLRCLGVTSAIKNHRNSNIYDFQIGEGGVQSTLFCIFNHCYFISSLNKLKICHTIKQLYIHNIMPKHENNDLQKNFYNRFKKGTFSVECAPCLGVPVATLEKFITWVNLYQNCDITYLVYVKLKLMGKILTLLAANLK